MRREDGGRVVEPNWHDRESVALVAGVVAFALLAILAFAVIKTSHDATDPAQFVAPPTSETTSGPSIKTVPTTSYTAPSVQTSEFTPPPAPPLPPSDDIPVPDDATPPSAPSTIFNPYATTTQPSAGHV